VFHRNTPLTKTTCAQLCCANQAFVSGVFCAPDLFRPTAGAVLRRDDKIRRGSRCLVRYNIIKGIKDSGLSFSPRPPAFPTVRREARHQLRPESPPHLYVISAKMARVLLCTIVTISPHSTPCCSIGRGYNWCKRVVIKEHSRLCKWAHCRVMEKRGHQPCVAQRLARVHVHARLSTPPALLHAALNRLQLQLRLCASSEGVRDEP
jgi:hypothetical protein